MSRFVRTTRGAPGVLDQNGLEVLRTALWEGGREVESIATYSGAPGRQNFRTLALEQRGVLEPIPEGVYSDIGDLEWAGGRGNYAVYWSPALGPVVIQIYGARAIMAHLDANRSYAPGSAGCVCPLDLVGLMRLVAWWEAGKPEWWEVDWGLGTVRKPVPAGKVVVASPPPLVSVGFDFHDGRAAARRLGTAVPALTCRLDYHSDQVGFALDGRQLDPSTLRAIALKVVYQPKQ